MIYNLNFIDNDFDGNPCTKLKERTMKLMRVFLSFKKKNEHVYQEYHLKLSK